MDHQVDPLVEQRIKKLQQLREAGINPYPYRFDRTHLATDVLGNFDALQNVDVRIAGRLITMRVMGKAGFAHFLDQSGQMQIYVRRDVVGDAQYELFTSLDSGDFLGASGKLFRTRTGEITLGVQQLTLLCKALRPLPEKWHGLTDIEKRYRQRYLDLISNEKVREVFRVRSRTIDAIRRYLVDRDFLEVETPILQPIHGGAAARPFATHHNALDRDLYLRIALELYLKRCVIGGIERVFEIGRNFRNEGISTRHNPEFTMLELYQAYADYNDIMALWEELVFSVAQKVLGTTELEYGGHTIDLRPPWPRIKIREAIRIESGIDYEDYPTAEALNEAVRRIGMHPEPGSSRAKLIDGLLSEYVEQKLIQPTFLIDYPVEMSPLAKRKRDDPAVVERFEAYIGGMEIANAFSELNDPIDQRERFEQQVAEKSAGNEETHPMDEEFLPGLGAWHAPDRRVGNGHRPVGHAVHRQHLDPRGDFLSAVEDQGIGCPMGHPLCVAFVWHMHQPYYLDAGGAEFVLPWVRMHAAKDYLHMAEVLEDYPDVHATFNFVPSLVEQLQAYVDGTAVDRAWNVSLRERLSPQDKQYIDSLFFSVNQDRSIRPYPRYWQLLKLREQAEGDLDLLGDGYWQDLIAWFNLAWFDPGWIERDPVLRALVAKGSHMTLEDVGTILAKQGEVMGNTLPAYRRLQRRGQVELSVSPYYHPILPLLIDSNCASEPSPGLGMPCQRFQRREDALDQLTRAVAYHEATFGRPPAGLWPSEGAVSQELVELLSEVPEIHWLATDEAILARSFGRNIEHNGWGYVTDPRFLYRPYWAGSGEHRAAIVFRDHYLSDRIGFAYHGMTGRQGAEDLMFRFSCIQEMVQDDPEPSLVSIILDGENCWEAYERNGETFLRALYEMLSIEPRVRTVTVNEFLTEFPPQQEIPRLATGSWINGNLETWIGEPAQNRAWEYLCRTRETLAETAAGGTLPPECLEKGRRFMRAAEGSDWFWWYYSHNVTPQEDLFDNLFRTNLVKVHEALGVDPPAWLATPILEVAPKLASRVPRGYVHPLVAEHDLSPIPWAQAGYVDPKVSTGSMQQGSGLLKRLYFGYDKSKLFLRLESHSSLKGYLVDAYVDPLEGSFLSKEDSQTGEGAMVTAAEGRPSLEIAIRPELGSIELSRWQEAAGWLKIEDESRLAVGAGVIEVAVPLATLGMRPESPVGLAVVLYRDNVVVQRLPEAGQVVVRLSSEF